MARLSIGNIPLSPPRSLGRARPPTTGRAALLLPRSRDVELEEDDVPVLDLVGLPFLAVPACSFHGRLGALLLELVKSHDLGTDEPALEVRVDHARCLGCLVASPDDP